MFMWKCFPNVHSLFCSFLSFLNLCYIFLTWTINCQLNRKTGYSLKFHWFFSLLSFFFSFPFPFIRLFLSFFCLQFLFRWNISLFLSIYSACYGLFLMINSIPSVESFFPPYEMSIFKLNLYHRTLKVCQKYARKSLKSSGVFFWIKID